MKSNVSRLGARRKPFRCNPRSYKSHRPPKVFLVNRIRKKLQVSGIQAGILLDIGCGNGGYIDALSRHMDMSFVGMDNSMEMLEQATTHRCTKIFINASFNSGLPFKSGIFNAIISVDSIHFCVDMDFLFQEINRILIPGGIFVICTHTEDDLKRQTLGAFFPKTMVIEASAAKKLKNICGIARKRGLRQLAGERDIKTFSPNSTYIKLFSKKCASALHYIPPSDFYKGIQRLKYMAATKIRVAVDSYTTFVFQKPHI
jgi:SAM-dependent methyltransferase